MKILLSLLALSLVNYSLEVKAQANSDTMFSLNSGNYCYSVYKQESEASMNTVIEIKEEGVDQDCDGAPSMSMVEVMVSVGFVIEDKESSSSFNQIRPISSVSALRKSSSSPSSGLKLMKKGVVKFFNDAKKKIYVGNLPYSATSENYLILPPEIQRDVSEAKPMAPREKEMQSNVIIIYRFEVQEGKKGLNAVNVKKA